MRVFCFLICFVFVFVCFFFCFEYPKVNTNGAISFERTVSQYTPQPFPLGDNRVLVAPFWADVDIRQRGKVSYQEIVNPVSDEFIRAKTEITTAFNKQAKFTPTWLFITTWDKVPFYDDTRSTSKVIAKTLSFASKLFCVYSIVSFIHFVKI